MANAFTPTYPELVLEVQDICENTNSEFISNIPRFVHRGQDTVQRDLGLDIWRDYQTATPIGIGASSYTRSQDWLIVRSLYLPTQNKWIEKRHLDYVRMYGGSAGRPRVWAEDTETAILLAPAADISYNLRVEFYKRLDALSDANPTNWITRNAGDLLLLQTLVNAMSYLVAPERVQEFSMFYAAILQSAVPELRETERARYEPIRIAARPAVQPGMAA